MDYFKRGLLINFSYYFYALCFLHSPHTSGLIMQKLNTSLVSTCSPMGISVVIQFFLFIQVSHGQKSFEVPKVRVRINFSFFF